VWRGGTNNTVWMSFNNGRPFQIGTTATNVAPVVAAFGPQSFMVIHTGTDGNIYYAIVFANGSSEQSWTPIPWQTTQMPLSAVQMGAGSGNVYMVYREYGGDTHVWGTWFDLIENEWMGRVASRSAMPIPNQKQPRQHKPPRL
jgi:hypothetical protein